MVVTLEWRLPRASGRWRPGLLVSTLQCPGHPTPESHPAPDVSRAQAEKPWARSRSANVSSIHVSRYRAQRQWLANAVEEASVVLWWGDPGLWCLQHPQPGRSGRNAHGHQSLPGCEEGSQWSGALHGCAWPPPPLSKAGRRHFLEARVLT